MAEIRCRVLSPDAPARELPRERLDEIEAIRSHGPETVWLDLLDPDEASFELLRREFRIHPLAEEDLQKRGQRPKVDTYPDQHMLVLYEAVDGREAAHTGPRGRRRHFRLSEVHLFAGDHYLVSVRWHASPAIDDLMQRARERGEVVGRSPARLLYSVIDGIVDGYFPILDRLSDRIDDLEDRIIAGNQGSEVLRDVLHIKRELLELRRVLAPMRDVANALLRRELPMIGDEDVPYFQDLYDHLVRVLDQLDLYRDLVAATLDANLSVTSNNLNAVMKRLTAFTVILMLPTLIAGIYGMNFHHMPELAQSWGYPFALGLMVVVAGGAAAFFRARDWF